MSKSSRRFTLLSLALVGLLEARQESPRGPWTLPPVAKQQRSFLEECESLMAFLEKVRGGSDRGFSYYEEEYRQQRGQQPPPTYRGEDRYGHDDRYSPKDDPYYSERRGSYEDDPYYDYYDDRGSTSRRETSDASSLFSNAPSILKNGDRRIGLALLASGSMITMLGISLFFNKTLMRLGNLLFIAGVPVTIGPSRTTGYFLKPEKYRATACLALGIFLVFVGHPVFGMILEAFGLLNLFGNMFPVLMAIAKNMPVIGPLLNGNDNRRTAGARDRYAPPRRNYDDRQYYDGPEDADADTDTDPSRRYY